MKVTVGLFFGGKSTEHEVSVITGLQAFAAINKEKYDVVPIYITKENEFYTGESVAKIEEYADIPSLLKKSMRVMLVNDSSRVKICELSKKGYWKAAKPKRAITLDVAFPAVHGTNVEDGALQGFFETLGLPYAGCDVISSAIGMDKAATKAILKQAGVSVLDCVAFTAKRFIDSQNAVVSEVEELGFPVIVKPVNLGSSIGIKLARDKAELVEAIEHALLFAEKVIVERAIVNLKEINCAVLGDKDCAEAGECEEPVSSNEILNFEDKYCNPDGKGGAKSAGGGMASLKRKIPADISDSQRDEIRALAVKAFKALGCGGVARIDFLLDLDEKTDTGYRVWFNEINTIPGSLAFYLWEPVGVAYPELLDRIIKLALKREREKANLSFTFDNNILSNFKKGGKSGDKFGGKS